jgi:hypothetical protein
MVDKVERTVSEYAWLCIRRAHVQRPLSYEVMRAVMACHLQIFA